MHFDANKTYISFRLIYFVLHNIKYIQSYIYTCKHYNISINIINIMLVLTLFLV